MIGINLNMFIKFRTVERELFRCKFIKITYSPERFSPIIGALSQVTNAREKSKIPVTIVIVIL